ncbi:MAG TPA: hypothetical protein ENI86_00570 [Acidimicrobiales bacterium]|nr:hypothetical protein [Acidimicrobiales bacterium]
MSRTRGTAAIVLALALFATACGSGRSPAPGQATGTSTSSPAGTTATNPSSTEPETTTPGPSTAETAEPLVPATGSVLATGTVEVPGAQSFEDPGFHEPLEVSVAVPAELAGRSGRLVLRLADAARPGITCEREHPLSGCVTVDWSDFADRPGVPPGGVFDNHLAVTTAGPGTGAVLFLSETGLLASAPDDYAPG